jgi:hypothetical protein
LLCTRDGNIKQPALFFQKSLLFHLGYIALDKRDKTLNAAHHNHHVSSEPF